MPLGLMMAEFSNSTNGAGMSILSNLVFFFLLFIQYYMEYILNA
jgi:hypothetical protein